MTHDITLVLALDWLADGPRRVERSPIASFATDVTAAWCLAHPGDPGDPGDVEALINWLAAHYPWRLERRRAEAGVELVCFVSPTGYAARDAEAIVRQWRAARSIEEGMARMGDGRRRRRRVSSR